MLDAGDLIAADMAADWPVLRDRLLEMADARSYIVVGGDHSVAIPSLAAQQARHGARLAVLYVDAHPDLCDVSRGSPFTHGCALRRGIELSPIDPRRVMVLACRDFDAEEVAYAAASGVTLITMAEVARDGIARAAERVREWLPADAKLHISFDIDALDPAHAPGTTLPAPGGLTTREGLTLLQLLRGSDLCGFDLVEVNPPADTDDITSLAALKLIFQFLALQARVA
jgi:arginase